jgi:hypothetical protein
LREPFAVAGSPNHRGAFEAKIHVDRIDGVDPTDVRRPTESTHVQDLCHAPGRALGI